VQPGWGQVSPQPRSQDPSFDPFRYAPLPTGSPVAVSASSPSTALLVAAACGFIALVAAFLPWIQASGFTRISENAVSQWPILLIPPVIAIGASVMALSQKPRQAAPAYIVLLAFVVGIALCIAPLNDYNSLNSSLGDVSGMGMYSIGFGFLAYLGASVLGIASSAVAAMDKG
jgi:hypothetical protein